MIFTDNLESFWWSDGSWILSAVEIRWNSFEVVSMFISWKNQGCKNDNTNISFWFHIRSILQYLIWWLFYSWILIYLLVFRTLNGFDFILKSTIDNWKDFPWKEKFTKIFTKLCPRGLKLFLLIGPITTTNWKKLLHIE